MFNSVRFRITLWYAAALAVTLALFSVVVYNNLERSLDENLDQLLAVRAEGVADALEAYLETERIEVGRYSASAAKGGAFFKIAPELVRLHTEDPKQAAVELRILDASGAELENSRGSAGAPELPDRTLKDALKGNAVYDTIKISQGEGPEATYRSYATPASGTGGAVYIVQAYRSTYHTQFALKKLRVMMAAMVPLIVLLTGAFGMFFARVALRPVANMARTLRQITAENLSLRIKPPETRDEIRELADLFNAMLARLEDSFLSERRFIQDVSHELKTPLTILKGELEVALKKARSVGEYTAVLQSNLEETEKMSKIVGDLLTLARFDNREVRLERSRVNLKTLLGGAAGSLSGLAEKSGASIELSRAADSIEVEADQGQLGRLFLNLLDNALKYGGPGGKIKVNISMEAGRPAVSVSDSGPGIPAGDLPHIFKRFYRADSSRSSSGFGLGLAIAKSIADAHGAEIKAESPPGQGSTFTVIFPPPQH
ncbi:MAG: heavy metal sensor histidine kinase [Elusimicrobiales bacterium]|nr:heavy metal sensor histidine kinase [Elusimicrobiales bacterium]